MFTCVSSLQQLKLLHAKEKGRRAKSDKRYQGLTFFGPWKGLSRLVVAQTILNTM